MDKQKLFELVDSQKEHLFDMSCQIFDNPEIDGKEYFASALLVKDLEEKGFTVETGIGGLETSFRAVWKNAGGGLNIGILGEYDALRDKGHGCGHHLQTTAAIGAAQAIKEMFAGTEYPVTITIYGTPAEETFGGKIIMEENGCFKELDVVLGTHATSGVAFVGGNSMALSTYEVTFKGIASHAAGRPWMGRSAADAMMLSFHGVECLREHVKDGTRMHYTIPQALGPSNVVPETASANYTVRSRDNTYLAELEERLLKVIHGACMMTETTCELKKRPVYAARKKNEVLALLAKANLEALGLEFRHELIVDSGGSTDFGNTSCIVPGALVYLHYNDGNCHSTEWVNAGKTEEAEVCLMDSAKVMAGMMYDLILDPSVAKRAKEEFDASL